VKTAKIRGVRGAFAMVSRPRVPKLICKCVLCVGIPNVSTAPPGDAWLGRSPFRNIPMGRNFLIAVGKSCPLRAPLGDPAYNSPDLSGGILCAPKYNSPDPSGGILCAPKYNSPGQVGRGNSLRAKIIGACEFRATPVFGVGIFGFL
jgi:hypothetical protein